MSDPDHTRDPFEELVDELTALRRSIEHLARTSLDKNEAKILHQHLVEGVAGMRNAASEAPGALRSALKADREVMAQNAANAAQRAAQSVLGDIRGELARERQILSQAAGEARREAWRYFGGFWVWITTMLATGAVLGVLAAYGMETAKSALSLEDLVRTGCGKPGIGGQIVESNSNGRRFCAFWIEPE